MNMLTKAGSLCLNVACVESGGLYFGLNETLLARGELSAMLAPSTKLLLNASAKAVGERKNGHRRRCAPRPGVPMLSITGLDNTPKSLALKP
jgi:hypothetical protein